MRKVGILLGLSVVVALSSFSFASASTSEPGANVSDSSGTVYFISREGTKRPYTSAAAFLSYGFNSWGSVRAASADDLALPTGAFIPPQDGSIVCSDRGSDAGTCYLVTEGRKAGFISEYAFTSSGYSFSNAMYGDVSWMSKTQDIQGSHQAHRPGTLINSGGTIQLVIPGGLMGIPSMAAFNSWGYSLSKVVPAVPADGNITQVRVMQARVLGDLHPLDRPESSGTSYQEGWLENAQGTNEVSGSTGFVAGWVYDNDSPVSVVIVLENVNNPQQTVTLNSNPTQQRTDVASYLNGKLSKNIKSSTGFYAYIPYGTPSGLYRIKSATYNGYAFSVRNEASAKISVNQNHHLEIVTPNGGESLSLGQQVSIAWTDVNGDGSPTQTYTVFLTRRDGGGTWVLGDVVNSKQLYWTVGNSVGGSPYSIQTNSGYYIQVVKQFVTGEDSWDETDGSFSIVAY